MIAPIHIYSIYEWDISRRHEECFEDHTEFSLVSTLLFSLEKLWEFQNIFSPSSTSECRNADVTSPFFYLNPNKTSKISIKKCYTIAQPGHMFRRNKHLPTVDTKIKKTSLEFIYQDVWEAFYLKHPCKTNGVHVISPINHVPSTHLLQCIDISALWLTVLIWKWLNHRFPPNGIFLLTWFILCL